MAARLLVDRHREPAQPDHDQSLLNFAEVAHDDDWSLRSALVRLAQPEPVRAGAILEVIRRCEGALQPRSRPLERHTVACQRSLSPTSLVPGSGPEGWQLDDDGLRYPDIRTADLARLAGSDPAALTALTDAYRQLEPLDADEEAALPVLQVAAGLERLAIRLAAWAVAGPAQPPVDEVDEVCAALSLRLDELGVARETPPTERRRGGEPYVGERRRGGAKAADS